MTPLPKYEPKIVERRRHQRVKVVLLGRYMLSDRKEFPCQSIDISPGGVALVAPIPGEVGERVVCYLDQLGRLEGVVARRFDTGFALCVNVPLLKREKLAEQLTWLANRQSLGMPEDRRHERIVPRNTRTSLTLNDGSRHPAKLHDVSLSGAAVLVNTPIAIGTPVTIGNTVGRVVRSFNNGIGIEFSRLLNAAEFDENVVL